MIREATVQVRGRSIIAAISAMAGGRSCCWPGSHCRRCITGSTATGRRAMTATRSICSPLSSSVRTLRSADAARHCRPGGTVCRQGPDRRADRLGSRGEGWASPRNRLKPRCRASSLRRRVRPCRPCVPSSPRRQQLSRRLCQPCDPDRSTSPSRDGLPNRLRQPSDSRTSG